MSATLTLLSYARRGLLVLVAAAGCGAEPARPVSGKPPRPVKVEVALAERTRRPVVSEVVGTVRAVRSATLAPLIGGTVTEIRGLGSAVVAGEVLVRLSAREIDARLDQARAAAALAKLERDRTFALRTQDAISVAQHDAADSQWSIARARQAEATAVARHAVLRAPFAGVVTARLASVGDTAMPGQGLLVLEAPGAFRFEARVPESAGDRLAIGDSVTVRLDGVDHDLEGTLAELQPAADDATRTRLAKVDLPATPGLRSGRFGRLLLATGTSLVVSVPAEALVRRGQLEGVFVVELGAARLRLVRSGRERDGRVEIASGLTGVEEVVLPGAAPLLDGQRVEVAR
jgi:membrane fusion protein (multidrug efflux system)